jgi:hypothetical protein
MLQEIKNVFTQLDGVQKGIFIFWLVCVLLFVLSFINLFVYGIKLKISKIK